jgi:allophanate hydrolase
VAITGSAVGTLDGVKIGGWRIVGLEPGSRLRVDSDGGNWGYIGLAGRLERRAWLGSLATHQPSGLGGGLLEAAASLQVSDCWPAEVRALPAPAESPLTTVPVVMGPQHRFFAAAALETFVEHRFSATFNFDRMGMMLDGPPLLPGRLDMASEPIVRGSLQVNGAGRLTMLMADHQTTGGYPRIACAVGRAIDRLAQSRPGTAIRFLPISPQEAIASVRKEAAARRAYLANVAEVQTLNQRLMTRNLIAIATPDEICANPSEYPLI